MHRIIILLDGATDDRIPSLGNLTPLQAAEMPFINSITTAGRFGCTDACGYTHLFLLELLSRRKENVPRGLIETLGFNLTVPPGRIGYRLSPATIKNGWMEWGYIISEEEVGVLKASFERNLPLIDHLKPEIRYYGEGKGVMTIESDDVLDLPSPPVNAELDLDSLGPLRELVEAVRDETGGWVILPWQGGRGDMVEKYKDVRKKLCGISFLSNSPSALGVGAFLGMNKIWIDDLEERIEKASHVVDESDVLLHIEEIDDMSHKRDPQKKLEFLEEVDILLRRYFQGKNDVRLSLIVDHGASSLTGEHDENPVPFAVSEDLSGESAGRSFQETRQGYIPLPELLDLLMGG
jgi:2,3-bisphosphoglycerate-independent phosphoglycerate mutase